MLLLLMILVSCKLKKGNPEDPTNGSNNGAQSNSSENNGIAYTIVFADGTDGVLLDSLFQDVYEATGIIPTLSPASSAKGEYEIVVGNTDREISKKAYSALNRIDITSGNSEFAVKYAVYVLDGSVAIAYDSASALRYAIAKLFETVGDRKFAFEGHGILLSGDVSLLSIADEKRKEMRDEALSAINEKYGEDLVNAVKRIYNIYSPDLYVWLANLWDPDRGGFYYSASGRDTLGYLPDIESTAQAMSILSTSNMLENFGGDYSDAISEDMRAAMLEFALSLQDKDDGFFYHPQWGKSVNTARRARDLSWATSIIEAFGEKPLYDTPTGTQGSIGTVGVSSVTSLSDRLGGSSAVAVSKVIGVSDSRVPEHIRTPEAIREYIIGLNFHSNSYNAGSTLSTQRAQIKNAGSDVVNEMFKTLEELQFSHNGLWEETVSYQSSNGFMMLSALYSYFRRAIPCAQTALDSVLEIMLTPDGAVHICSVYNPWASLANLLSNIKIFGTANEYNRISANIASSASELVNITVDKLMNNYVGDGGFSYFHGRTSYLSQGALVALPNAVESDVNATAVSITMVNCMEDIFGIDIPIFCGEDLDCFLALVKSFGTIVKNDIIPQVPVSFDTEELENVKNINYKDSANFYKYEIVADPSPDENADGDLAMLVEVTKGEDGKKAQASGVTEIDLWNLTGRGMCYVLDVDLYYESTDAISNLLTQIFFKGSKYVFSLQLNAYDGGNGMMIKILEHDGAGTYDTLAQGIPFGKWFNLRVEFYYEANCAQIYVDGKMVAETDLYWEENTGESVSYCNFLHYRGVAQRLYLDNLVFEKIDKKYSEYVAPPKVPANFDDGSLPGEVSNRIYGNSADFVEVSVVDDPKPQTENDMAMKFEMIRGASQSPRTYFTISNAEDGGKCYVLDMNLMYESSDTSSNMLSQIFFDGAASVFSLQIDVYSDLGIKKLKISEVNSAGVGDVLVRGLSFGKWINIRIEYYSTEHIGVIQINGIPVAKADLYWTANADVTIENCSILHYRNVGQIVYLDDVIFDRINKQFEDFTPPPAEEDIVLDLTSAEVTTYADGDLNLGNVVLNNPNGPGLGSDGTTAAVKFRFLYFNDPKNGANRVLRASLMSISYGYSSNTADPATIAVINPTEKAEDTNGAVYVFQTKVLIPSVRPNTAETNLPNGNAFRIDLLGDAGESYGSYDLFIYDSSYVTIRRPGASNVAILKTDSNAGYDKWFTLRFEVYKNDNIDCCGTIITVVTSTGKEHSILDRNFVSENSPFTDSTMAPCSALLTFTKQQMQRDVYFDDTFFTTVYGIDRDFSE